MFLLVQPVKLFWNDLCFPTVERDYIPQTGEICFSRDALDGTAVMAWSYTHPRIISHLVVTPVPLSVPAIDVRYMEENIKVCVKFLQ